jgi:uncharacterized protein (DUF1015 family)
LFRDPSGQAHAELQRLGRGKALFDIRLYGIRHQLFVADQTDSIARIQKTLKNKNMYIADGHHRYEVASQSGAKYILTYLCDADRNDFTIFPTHRVLRNLKKGWKEVLCDRLGRHFDAQEVSTLEALTKSMNRVPRGKVAIGAYGKPGFWKFTTKKRTQDLDVMVLHSRLVRALLGEAVAGSDRIYFTRDAKSAVRDVKNGSGDVAFFLSKMPIGEMIRISDAGVKLPQKSTYFYPKLLSGIVFYKFS